MVNPNRELKNLNAVLELLILKIKGLNIQQLERGWEYISSYTSFFIFLSRLFKTIIELRFNTRKINYLEKTKLITKNKHLNF